MAATVTEPASVSDQEIIDQLAMLQDMHRKLFNLRSLLPERLITPIRSVIDLGTRGAHVTSGSPEKLSSHLRNVAQAGNRDLQSFKGLWHDDRIRDLWIKTNSANFPQGTDVWGIDYTEQQNAQKPTQDINQGDKVYDENPDDTVKVFRDRHPDIPLDIVKSEDDLIIDLKVSSQAIRVTRATSLPRRHYLVSEKPGSKMSSLKREMLQSLDQRTDTTSLGYVLEMIASYSEVQTRACDKCQEIFNTNFELATVRVPEDKTQPHNTPPTSWKAYHQTCI